MRAARHGNRHKNRRTNRYRQTDRYRPTDMGMMHVHPHIDIDKDIGGLRRLASQKKEVKLWFLLIARVQQ